jgi:hypothetical protein
MKRHTALLCSLLALALPVRAEFLQMDISIFGMD